MAERGLGRIYRDGEIVIREGEQDGHMHVVQEGEVEVLVERQGQEVLLAVRGRDEVLGEMAIFDRAPHSATVRARGDARILTVDQRGFLRRIQEDPSLAFHILKNLSMRVRDLSARLAHYEEQRRSLTGGSEVAAEGSPPPSPPARREGERSAEGTQGPSRFQAIERALPSPRRRVVPWLRAFLWGAVGTGLTAAVLRSLSVLPGHSAALDGVLGGVTALLGVEYGVRLYAAARSSGGPASTSRLRYALSLAGLVDLAAVAPMAAAVALGSAPDAIAALALLWVLKLARYAQEPDALAR